MHLPRTVKDYGMTKRVNHLVVYDQLSARIIAKPHDQRPPHVLRVRVLGANDVVIDMNRREIEIWLYGTSDTLEFLPHMQIL